MSTGNYVRKRSTKPRALQGSWLHCLAHLLEAGQASTDEIAHEGSGYVAGTVRSALSNMHRVGFVQRCPGMVWGLTKAGIDAAMLAEEDASKAAEMATSAKAEIETRPQSIVEAHQAVQRTKLRNRERAAHIGAMRRQGEVI